MIEAVYLLEDNDFHFRSWGEYGIVFSFMCLCFLFLWNSIKGPYISLEDVMELQKRYPLDEA
jgi:hypothetical protein